ncbi:MAG: hypothetical protein M3680_26790 [Myxococcota bacterium]|nr:hypothetical protein [Myxococcota bacterium]
MWRVLLLVASGCGRVGYEARPLGDGAVEPEDGGTEDGQIDASIDAVAPVGCGTLLLDDPFDDGMAAPSFVATAEPGLTVSEAEGRMRVQFAASVTGNRYGHYRSITAYPTAGLCVVVRPVELPANGGAVYLKLRTAQLEVEFYGHGTVLELRKRQSSVVETIGTLPFDLAVHAFWRLRQQGTTTFWDTSTDGVTFTARGMLDGFFSATTCQFELGAGSLAAITDGGFASFESAAAYGP